MFENVGKALTLIREIRGMSQAEVARRAGTGKSQISKYENGKELPKLDTLRNVLRALEIGHFEFFYTVHLIDIQVANLDLREQVQTNSLPPLPLGGKGLLADETDAAFRRILEEIMSLYHNVWKEKLSNPSRRN
jgi:transcriptional regulator with XRE-family HTH domain